MSALTDVSANALQQAQQRIHDDLLTALDQEFLSFAALDVFEEEPLPAESPVHTHSKILATPHIAGFMDDYLGTLRPIIEENLQAFIDREELPVSEVDLERKY